MIYVSQGHQKGIGVEVFLKSYLCLSDEIQSQIIFSVEKSVLIENIQLLNFDFKLINNDLFYLNTKLKILYCDDEPFPTSTLKSIHKILSLIKNTDVLLTLPSSKDEFKANNSIYNGHTEYFRYLYPNNNPVMCFLSQNTSMILLTDHIPLNDVTKKLTDQYIYNKVKTALPFFINNFNISSVFFAGINPHAGENGLIGSGDENVSKAIRKLESEFNQLKFFGPLSGDTLHLKSRTNNELLVYSFHDQALAYFKSKTGFFGANITIGLDYLRVSVDHGTAFDLYGKNSADYFGLVSVFEIIKRCGHN